MWIVFLLIAGLYVFTCMIGYHAYQKSKELGILEQAVKHSYEPAANLLVLGGVFYIIALLDWIF